MFVIRIIPAGQIGNQMLQLIYAQAIADRLGGRITGYDLPMWGLRAPPDVAAQKRPLVIGGHLQDIDRIVALVRKFGLHHFWLRTFRFRIEDFPDRARIKALFDGKDADAEGFGDDTLVIHIRAGDALCGEYPDYGPLPFSYYRQLIARTGLRPVFMGQLGDDFYSRGLRAQFKAARFIESRAPLVDFETLRRSKHVAISASTFAWLAAWLSEAATIHLPLAGILNPAQRPEINLLPVGDRRYRYYSFPVRYWTASEADIARLSEELPLQEIDAAEVERRLRHAWRRTRLRRLRKDISLYRKAALAALRQRWGWG
jgi:hypothetical protein